jgi:hypothetical protein
MGSKVIGYGARIVQDKAGDIGDATDCDSIASIIRTKKIGKTILQILCFEK